MANPYSAYLESPILLASPLELVHLAYQTAIEALGEAREHLTANRFVPRVQAVTKVQQIIIHLQSSLDYEKGGELSQTLSRLYNYMLRRLNEGNRTESDACFAEVQQLLETVGGAWKQIASGESAESGNTGQMAAAASVSNASAWMTDISQPSGSTSAWTSESTSPWVSESTSAWMNSEQSEPSVYTRSGYSL